MLAKCAAWPPVTHVQMAHDRQDSDEETSPNNRPVVQKRTGHQRLQAYQYHTAGTRTKACIDANTNWSA